MHSIATQGHITSAMRLIGEAGQDIAAYYLSGIQCAILVGEKLREAKKLVDHGEWLTCLREDGRFSERMAQKFMRAFDLHEEIEAEIRRGNSDLTLDQMLALFAKKSPKVIRDKPKELDNSADGKDDSNGNTTESTPVAQSPAPCTATDEVANNIPESSTSDFAGTLAPTGVVQVEAVPSIDNRTVADDLAEKSEEHYMDSPETGGLVIDVASVPSVSVPAETTLAEKFAEQFAKYLQERGAVEDAITCVVAQARAAIAKAADAIKGLGLYIHFSWTPEMLATVIASGVAVALTPPQQATVSVRQ